MRPIVVVVAWSVCWSWSWAVLSMVDIVNIIYQEQEWCLLSVLWLPVSCSNLFSCYLVETELYCCFSEAEWKSPGDWCPAWFWSVHESRHWWSSGRVQDWWKEPHWHGGMWFICAVYLELLCKQQNVLSSFSASHGNGAAYAVDFMHVCLQYWSIVVKCLN